MKSMEREDYNICYTDEIWIRNGKRVNQKLRHRKYTGWIFEQCLPLCIISPSSVVIKRELFDSAGLFDESLPACEDYDLWLRVTCRHPVLFIEKPLIIKTGRSCGSALKKIRGYGQVQDRKSCPAPDVRNSSRGDAGCRSRGGCGVSAVSMLWGQ